MTNGGDGDRADSGEGDRILTAIGVGLVLFIVFGVGVGVLAAANAGSRTADAPGANWTIERANVSYVRIAHAGGDPVDGEELIVVVDGIKRRAPWPDRVTEGDSVAIRARDGETVQLYWTGARDERVLLASRAV